MAGHRGMVGSAVVRRLQQAGYHNLVMRTSQELDLRDQAAVAAFFAPKSPNMWCWPPPKWAAFMANNTYRADFLLRQPA